MMHAPASFAERPKALEHAAKTGTRESFRTRHDVGGHRADHERKREPGDGHTYTGSWVLLMRSIRKTNATGIGWWARGPPPPDSRRSQRRAPCPPATGGSPTHISRLGERQAFKPPQAAMWRGGARPKSPLDQRPITEGRGRLRQGDAELLLEPCRQIAAPPAHHAVDRRVRTALHSRRQRRPLLRVQLARRTRSLAVLQALRPFRIEAQHPVPDDLQTHTRKARRIRTTMTVVDHRKRQKATALRPVPAPLRNTTKTSRSEISTQRKRSSHNNPPIKGSHLEAHLSVLTI